MIKGAHSAYLFDYMMFVALNLGDADSCHQITSAAMWFDKNSGTVNQIYHCIFVFLMVTYLLKTNMYSQF